jgi:hypothetical protein
MMPRVVFGAKTGSDASVADALPLSAARGPGGGGPRGGGGQSAPALHFVAEAADARGPLRAARTSFLSTGALVRDVFAGEERAPPPFLCTPRVPLYGCPACQGPPVPMRAPPPPPPTDQPRCAAPDAEEEADEECD